MVMFNSGDLVTVAAVDGPKRGQIIDVRCEVDASGASFAFVVGLDGVREPIVVTDATKLRKLNT